MAITGNRSSEIGDVMLMRAPAAVAGIFTVESYTDDVGGETATRFFTREFRYSTDQGSNYTAWEILNASNVSDLEIEAFSGLILEYRYTRAGTDTTGDLEFNSVSLVGDFRRSFFRTIKNTMLRLYPTGRAFQTPPSGTRNKVQDALLRSEDRALEAGRSILDSILPDTDRFTTDNATEWERRLGLPNGTGLALSVRKGNILRKLRHPGTIPARQNFRYLEAQLQAAGFDVYVHENRFPKPGGGFESKPYVAVAGTAGQAVHSPFVQHGQIQHGGSNVDLIANSTEKATDEGFNVNANFERTFFVGGAILGDKADVLASREKEFRQLILEVKPVQTVAYLFVNYI